jgi:hypothetical protein
MVMTNMLNKLFKRFKHRKHERYVVKDGTFVIISPSDTDAKEKKVQLIDISHGGMAFIYKGSPSELESSGVLKLLTDTKFAKKIEFDTVSDIPVPECKLPSEPFRRRGVRFRWMGLFEQSELKDIIKEVGICEKI